HAHTHAAPYTLSLHDALPISTRAAWLSSQVTTAISASEAATTPSRTAPAVGERRSFGMSGPLTATKKNAGRKMATVATAAPAGPDRKSTRLNSSHLGISYAVF